MGKVILDKIAVLSEPAPKETISESGIITLSESSNDKPIKGEVILVGPGRTGEEMEIKVGEQVSYNKFAGTKIKDGEQELTILAQGEILFIH